MLSSRRPIGAMMRSMILMTCFVVHEGHVRQFQLAEAFDIDLSRPVSP
jgi:hypothetical protein